MKKALLLPSFLFLFLSVFSQDTTTVNFQKRLNTVKYTSAGMYGATMLGLGTLWYADEPSSSFHFLNDGGAWLFMDKFGHSYATFQTGRLLRASFMWAGMEHKKATLWAAGSAFAAISSIEVFDGLSESWGASPTDLVANLSGATLLSAQYLLWKEEKIRFKWSYAQSGFPKYRPNALGSNMYERWLKDYNGQVYWLSTSPTSFFKKSKFPEWLGIAIGYSADGIVGAYENPQQIDGVILPVFKRRKQLYLGPDLFLDKIKTRSKFLNTLFFLSSGIRLPLPALELTEGKGWDIYWGF